MKFLTLLVAALLFTQTSLADVKADVKDLDDRLFDLEERLQGKYPATPIDSKKLRIGGTMYHDQRYAVSAADGYKDSLMSMTRIDLLFAGDVTQNVEYIFVPAWFYMSPRNNMDAANRSAEGARQTMQMNYRLNMSYKFNGNHRVTIGRFMAPFGSYVDTYSPSADNMSYWPQMVFPSGGVTFSPVLDGLVYKGQSFFNGMSWKYNVYAAIHSVSGEYGNPFFNYLMAGTPNKHNYGFRSTLGFWNDKITIGMSGQFGERDYGSSIYKAFKAYGADLNVNLGKFKFRAEYMKTDEGDVADGNAAAVGGMLGAGTLTGAQILGLNSMFRNFMASYLDSDKTSYYAEASYRFNQKFMAGLRYDYADFASLLFHHGKAKKIIGATLNYFPIDKLMLKFSVDKHDYDATVADIGMNPFAGFGAMMGGVNDAAADPNYMEYSLSATLSF